MNVAVAVFVVDTVVNCIELAGAGKTGPKYVQQRSTSSLL